MPLQLPLKEIYFEKPQEEEFLSRRNFLSGSVAATVASRPRRENCRRLELRRQGRECVNGLRCGISLCPAHLAQGPGKGNESLGGIPRRVRGACRQARLPAHDRAAPSIACTLTGNFTAGDRAAPRSIMPVSTSGISPTCWWRGRTIVAVEVAGYNVNAYYVLDAPSFLQAEVVTDSDVLASTAGAGSPLTPSSSPSY